MDLADQAFMTRRRGDLVQAQTLLYRAFELEKEAAETYRYDFSAEPTRSVLYRSAASLAIDCNELREAERLLATGLQGDPPEEIADEIRKLMDQVKFAIRLKKQSLTLHQNEAHSRGRIDVVIGRLLLADGRKPEGKLKLIDNLGNEHEIIVPEGMMTDIVRPLWDDIVRVKGVRVGKRLHLQEIVAA